jgi:hypothetical protein
MKRLILLFALVLNVGAYAQRTPIEMVGTATLTNADTVYLTKTVKGTYENVSLQVVVSKLSGTVAGTAQLQGSQDGVNYIDLGLGDLTLTDVTTNTKVWPLTNSNYYYYRIEVITSGTVSAGAVGYLFVTPGNGKHAVYNMLSSFDEASDTVTNTGTGYVEYQVKGWYNSIAFQAVSDSISGTPAGVITIQGSNDGVNFVTVNTSYSDAQTLTVLDQTVTSAIFIVTGSPYSYYRLSHTGVGTMVSRLRGYMLPSRK